MKFLALVLLAAVFGTAHAQTTDFTLGGPISAGCTAVTSQDGVPASNAGVCPQGFFGGGTWQVSLPDDPIAGGPLALYSCTGMLVSNGNIGFSTQPWSGVQVWSQSCQGSEGDDPGTWSGKFSINYVGVYGCARVGRSNRCGYFAQFSSGGGSLTWKP